jgi:NAD(P)-dependent dehydrogenase (short-subunit alcohol dehydrogenase family)
MQLQGKVAVVTGASQGIGEAAARAFHAQGCAVVLAARSEARLERIARDLGEEALPVPCDVRRWDDIEALARATRDRFGRCDVLVNNAGVGYGGTLAEMPVESIDETLAVNLRGVMLVAKAFLPLLQPDGAVLNIASVAGKQGSAGLAAYCASKAGVRIFSEALGLELAGRGVRVVSVCPGYVATAMVDDAAAPLEDMVQPADLAQVLVRLATQPRSAYLDEVTVWPRALYAD